MPSAVFTLLIDSNWSILFGRLTDNTQNQKPSQSKNFSLYQQIMHLYYIQLYIYRLVTETMHKFYGVKQVASRQMHIDNFLLCMRRLWHCITACAHNVAGDTKANMRFLQSTTAATGGMVPKPGTPGVKLLKTVVSISSDVSAISMEALMCLCCIFAIPNPQEIYLCLLYVQWTGSFLPVFHTQTHTDPALSDNAGEKWIVHKSSYTH